jgi:ribonuclease H / adenosylcobalamin/alpha-ribazole phosphatase
MEWALPQRVILIRHAEAQTIAADTRPLSPGRDVPLSAAGRKQARRLAGPLAGLGDGLYFSSPLPRATETARLATERLGAPFEIDPHLCEIDFGQWEGLTFEQMADRDPARLAGWAHFSPDFTFPGGERLGDFLDRIQALARRVAALNRPVTLVSHGGVIRSLICRLLGLDPRHYLLFGVDCASITQVELFGDRGVLVRLNDTCHLDEH